MHISIYTTGGTIDKVYFDAKSDYKIGAPQIVDILRESNVTFTYETTTLFSKDSLELTDEDRSAIAHAIANDPSNRILITHGTDTMVDTGQALLHIPDKTIVLVGSLSPARFKNSDAVFNIGVAVSAVQLLDPGVFIAMNGCIFESTKVRKNRAENRFEPIE
ncbi:MAG: asparaginase [Rhodothermaceae bacterium]|nr:asparaginase [Rhodothermaceae bacterium]